MRIEMNDPTSGFKQRALLVFNVLAFIAMILRRSHRRANYQIRGKTLPLYDSDSLIHHVEEAGFAGVSEREYLRSEIPDIEEVEEAGRVLDGVGNLCRG